MSKMFGHISDAIKNMGKKEEIYSGISMFVFIMAIYFYFIGFIYTYYFYRFFGINLYVIDIPFYSYFVFAYVVFARYWFQLLTIYFVLLILVFISKLHVLIKITLLFLIFFSFIYLKNISSNAGINDANLLKNSKKEPNIHFVFETESKKRMPLDLKNFNNELKLISQTKEFYFVLCKSPSANKNETKKDCVYVVRVKDVACAVFELP